jgi:NNP family nitrate/nitrite transporter-like MFS transporter
MPALAVLARPAGGYEHMLPLTMACLSIAVALGLVPHWYPEDVGTVTGVVGAAGGLGGFFPPLVMALVKSITGNYTLGFVLLAAAPSCACSS